MKFADKCVKVEKIMLSDVVQTQTDKFMFFFILGSSFHIFIYEHITKNNHRNQEHKKGSRGVKGPRERNKKIWVIRSRGW